MKRLDDYVLFRMEGLASNIALKNLKRGAKVIIKDFKKEGFSSEDIREFILQQIGM